MDSCLQTPKDKTEQLLTACGQFAAVEKRKNGATRSKLAFNSSKLPSREGPIGKKTIFSGGKTITPPSGLLRLGFQHKTS